MSVQKYTKIRRTKFFSLMSYVRFNYMFEIKIHYMLRFRPEFFLIYFDLSTVSLGISQQSPKGIKVPDSWFTIICRNFKNVAFN